MTNWITMTKKCNDCELVKPIDEFHKDRTRVDGLQRRCKPCAILRVTTGYRKGSTEPVRAVEGLKWCPDCAMHRPVAQFGKRGNGLQGYCMEHQRARVAESQRRKSRELAHGRECERCHEVKPLRSPVVYRPGARGSFEGWTGGQITDQHFARRNDRHGRYGFDVLCRPCRREATSEYLRAEAAK